MLIRLPDIGAEHFFGLIEVEDFSFNYHPSDQHQLTVKDIDDIHGIAVADTAIAEIGARGMISWNT